MTRNINDVAPQLPVRKATESGTFMVTNAPRYDEAGKFGQGWGLECADFATGERFVLLFSANKVRDIQMSQFMRAFADSDEPIGPCRLEQVKTNQPGRDAWNIVDATDLVGAHS